MRAELGRKAESYLKKGAVIPDNLLVDIILECVRYVALIQLLKKFRLIHLLRAQNIPKNISYSLIRTRMPTRCFLESQIEISVLTKFTSLLAVFSIRYHNI